MKGLRLLGVASRVDWFTGGHSLAVTSRSCVRLAVSSNRKQRKAAFFSTCPHCGDEIAPRTVIKPWEPLNGWVHDYCSDFLANQERINAGVTFRGHPATS